MKKTLLTSLLLMIIGFILGNKIEIKKNFPEKYYFLQEGVYKNDNIFEENVTDISKKVLEYRNNQIYVYIGITKDKKVAEKISKIYQSNHIPIKIEEVWLQNEEFRINIEQLDLLIKKTSNFDEVTKIEEVALASYEEILKSRE
ncbi:MAG: hypothetical protein IKF71_00645 [Bacilli bacterium]|nr:hypothetical protein [Bacilli bacterium]